MNRQHDHMKNVETEKAVMWVTEPTVYTLDVEFTFF